MRSMKDLPENKQKTVGDIVKIIVLVGIAVLIFVLMFFVANIMGKLLGAIIVAIIISYLLMPLQKMFEKHIKRGLAAFLCVAVSFGIVVLVITLILPILIKELSSASAQIGKLAVRLIEIVKSAEDKLRDMNIDVSFGNILSKISFMLETNTTDVIKRFVDYVIGFFKSLPAIVMVPVITFYVLKDRAYLISKIEFIIPVKWRGTLKNLFLSADRVITDYVKTQLLLAFIVGIATAMGYLLLGVPYAFLLGLLMGICEIIPYFGPVIGAVPACLLVLTSAPEKIIWTVAVIVGVQQLENSFLSPYVMGTNFDINPITVIIVLWIAGDLLGIAGFLFAIPIYVILKNLLLNLFNKLVKAG